MGVLCGQPELNPARGSLRNLVEHASELSHLRTPQGTHIPVFPETMKCTFAQNGHCYITLYQGHSVLSINSFPSHISVMLTEKTIQVFLEFVFVLYHQSCRSVN